MTPMALKDGAGVDRRPRLLDLFCGAGGAAMGYHRAGFEVVGVDIKLQARYPFEFHQADAFEWAESVFADSLWHRDIGERQKFDAIHASPPCQRWMGVPSAKGDEYPDLLTSTRELLRKTGLPYVIENIPTAPLDGPIFCGVSFGLPVVRHRRFETSTLLALVPSTCPQRSFRRSVDHPGTYPFAHGAWRPAWRQYVMPVLWPWMALEETYDAIPPAYTEWIGRQLLSAVGK